MPTGNLCVSLPSASGTFSTTWFTSLKFLPAYKVSRSTAFIRDENLLVYMQVLSGRVTSYVSTAVSVYLILVCHNLIILTLSCEVFSTV